MIRQRSQWRKYFTGLLGLCLCAQLHVYAQGFGGGGFGGGGGAAARRSGTTRQYPNNSMIGDAMVTIDPETRRVIVITDEETSQYVSQVITNLDRPVPQVLIKVVFLEVTYRKGSDIGVEGTYHSDPNKLPVAGVLQQFNNVPGIQSGQGLYTLVGSDYTVTLRAIAEAGKLEVLSRPSILARNNQQATITVGQEVPLVTNVRYDTFGNQINGITYRSVGIILRVTPFITSTNWVEMIVSPEISNLSDQTVAIATGTNATGAPIINTRSADTVVVTPDGQTVVIGGLMQNNRTESVSKIPILGDLPLLGAAFRRKVKGDSKTELLIFLTPYIVRSPAQLASMATTERSNLQITPKSFTEKDLNRFLEDVPVRPPDPASSPTAPEGSPTSPRK